MHRALILLLALILPSAGFCEPKELNYSLGTVCRKIIALSEQAPDRDLGTQIDFLRNFVFCHSRNVVDAEHNSYAFNTPLLLNKMLAHHYYGGPLPKASCGPRSQALAALLDYMGVKNRIIHVFSSHYPTLQSHTFNEVYYPDERRWALQDADYNLCFRPAGGGPRLSIEQVVMLPLMDVVPYTFNGRSDSWPLDPVYQGPHLQNFYGAALIPEGKTQRAIINLSKFDVTKRLHGYGSYAPIQELLRRHYGDPIVDLR